LEADLGSERSGSVVDESVGVVDMAMSSGRMVPAMVEFGLRELVRSHYMNVCMYVCVCSWESGAGTGGSRT
jgi:hypothetical protein